MRYTFPTIDINSNPLKSGCAAKSRFLRSESDVSSVVFVRVGARDDVRFTNDGAARWGGDWALAPTGMTPAEFGFGKVRLGFGYGVATEGDRFRGVANAGLFRPIVNR